MDNPNLDTSKGSPSGPLVAARGNYISFEEYLETGGDTLMSEWVDGTIIEMSPTSFDHQNIGSFLEIILRFFTERGELGTVIRAPFAMKLAEQKRGREPDIIFVRKEREHLIHKTFLDGAADLAIEIISPESIARDRAEKFVEYESAGIREFWLIDPERQIAEFYGLSEEGQYRLLSTAEGIFRSSVIEGFFLRTDWLWQKNPSTIAALNELGQIS